MKTGILKPDYFDNEYLAGCEPMARLLYAGLCCLADRDGVVEDRPLRIKKQVLGYDNADCEALLRQLAECEVGPGETPLIIRREVEGRKVIEIPAPLVTPSRYRVGSNGDVQEG